MWISRREYERLLERQHAAESRAAVAETQAETLKAVLQSAREQQTRWVESMLGSARVHEMQQRLKEPEPEWMQQVDWERVSGGGKGVF